MTFQIRRRIKWKWKYLTAETWLQQQLSSPLQCSMFTLPPRRLSCLKWYFGNFWLIKNCAKLLSRLSTKDWLAKAEPVLTRPDTILLWNILHERDPWLSRYIYCFHTINSWRLFFVQTFTFSYYTQIFFQDIERRHTLSHVTIFSLIRAI